LKLRPSVRKFSPPAFRNRISITIFSRALPPPPRSARLQFHKTSVAEYPFFFRPNLRVPLLDLLKALFWPTKVFRGISFVSLGQSARSLTLVSPGFFPFNLNFVQSFVKNLFCPFRHFLKDPLSPPPPVLFFFFPTFNPADFGVHPRLNSSRKKRTLKRFPLLEVHQPQTP